MPIRLDSRADFTLANYEQVAWRNERVQFTKRSLKLQQQCRRHFEALLNSADPPTIYGVNTGYGHRAKIKLGESQRKAQAAVPIDIWATSFGSYLPEYTARGIVFARLANFVEGHAAARPQIAESIASMLDGKLPKVPYEGHGCAGEILPLTHLFSGIGKQHKLTEKEALTLVNGSPCASAFLAEATLTAQRRIDMAFKVFALSSEAIRVPRESFAQELEELWGDECESDSLQRLRHLLEGGLEERRPYQAPVSFRIVPRLLGRALRSYRLARHLANSSLASVTDNPVFIMPSRDFPQGRVLSNGGFHNVRASSSMDNLSGAWADLCLLCERHTSRLLDPAVSLVEIGPRTESGEGYCDYLGMTVAGILEKARHWHSRGLLPGSESGGFDQNDVATSEVWAWQKERTIGECLMQAFAVLCAVSSQIFYTENRPAPPHLQAFLEEIRSHFPPVTKIRPLGKDVNRLSNALMQRLYKDNKFLDIDIQSEPPQLK